MKSSAYFLNILLFSSLMFLTGAQAATDCAQVTEIPQAECEELLTFYWNTNGPNWGKNEGWNVTNTPCS